MMEAPEVRLYVYENHNPPSVKSVAMAPERYIIEKRELESFSAMYTGMVSIAMTKMRPTTLMAMTTVSAESMSISV